jgi:hypothetical protein
MSTLRIYELDKPLMKSAGNGRIGYLNEPLAIRAIVDKLKSHFKMQTLRLALANGKTLGSIAFTSFVLVGVIEFRPYFLNV